MNHHVAISPFKKKFKIAGVPKSLKNLIIIKKAKSIRLLKLKLQI